MAQDARNDSVFEFQTNKDVKVMIATYKTGGYGLDFSVANKCILMDLWWNEAVQEQVCYIRRFEGRHRNTLQRNNISNSFLTLFTGLRSSSSTEPVQTDGVHQDYCGVNPRRGDADPPAGKDSKNRRGCQPQSARRARLNSTALGILWRRYRG